MDNLEDRIGALPLQRMKLADDPDAMHRPELALWAGYEADEGGAVATLRLAAQHGQPIRFVTLTPDDCRRLARTLNEMAAAIDREVQRTPVPA